MKHAILFRNDQDTEEEYQIAKTIWGEQVLDFRSQILPGTLVIPRYSCLPFYRELEAEVKFLGGKLLNTHQQHNYIADMEWVPDLGDMTPRTWFNAGYATVPETPHGWVVKGKTNSRKWKWNTHMRAPDRDALKEVMYRLLDDPLVREQGLAIREYVPLMKVEEAINGLPVTNEWRCFFLGESLLGAGYYWSQAEMAEEAGDLPLEAEKLVYQAAAKIAPNANFFVVDVGQTAEGGWIVIEINDGQMSGLSMVDPATFYTNLKQELKDAPLLY